MPLTFDEIRQLSTAIGSTVGIRYQGRVHIPLELILKDIAAYADMPLQVEFVDENGECKWRIIPVV